MASLHEYFVKDGSRNLTTHEGWAIRDADGVELGKVIARLHLDFDANASYVSFFIPQIAGTSCPEAIVLNKVGEILTWPQTQVAVEAGFGEERKSATELVFTGQIYLYSERPVSAEDKQRLMAEARKAGHRLTFRSIEYMNERNKWEKATPAENCGG